MKRYGPQTKCTSVKNCWYIYFSPRVLILFVASLLCCLSLSGCGFFMSWQEESIPSSAGQKVVRTAYSQMGKKYKAGAASPQKGFDCSGLVWWAYRVNGFNIPRITKDQARTGQNVPKHLVRAGDILVFRTGSGPQGLHTALYAGNNAFIHSPRAGKSVQMQKITLPYWKNNLVAVRRVVR